MRRKSERNKGKSPEPVTKSERPRRGRLSRKTRVSPSPEKDSKGEDNIQEHQDVVFQTGSERRKSGEGNGDDNSELVWQVKKSETSSNSGEIQKLKICLARSPSTPERPERPERSPRGKKRSSHSSVDTSSDACEERRKSRHKSRRNSGKDSMIEGVSETEDTDQEEVVELTPIASEPSQEEACDIQSKVECEVSSQDVATEVNHEMDKEENATNDGKDKNKELSQEQKTSTHMDVVIKESKTIEEKSEAFIPDNENPDCTSTSNRDECKQGEEIQAIEEKKLEEYREISKADEAPVTVEKSEIVEEKVVHGDENTTKNEVTENPTVENDICTSEESSSCHQNDKTISHTEDNVEDKTETLESSFIRKRRWGSRTTKINKSTVSISTDSLKSLIPKIEPVSVEDVLLDDKTKVESQHQDEVEEKVFDKKYNTTEKSKDREILGSSTHRKISVVSEESCREQRSPSPPRHKTSSVLFITNLVRPFTLPQLKNLLLRTGRIVENGFWIDKIKSKCFVQYQTEDEAIETRHALHGVTWPVSNPKTLVVDFSSESAMRDTMSKGDDDKFMSSADFRGKEQSTKENIYRQESEVNEKRSVIREWDVGKGDNRDMKDDIIHRNSNPDYIRGHLDNDRNEKRKRRSKSPSPARKFKKKEEEAPSKLLDDLFRKTKATPCIYWLPLNAETILIKEEQRRKHMAEHERRMEELRRVNDEQRGSRYGYGQSSRHR